MNEYYIQLFESSIILLIFIILRIITNRLIDRTMVKKFIQNSRGVLIKRAVNLLALFICILLISTVWGVNQSDLVVFVTSVLTVLGVAFFAQWSLISNITSSIIIFFNHSVKIDDTIRILEGKDYEIEGKVINIGLFFVTLLTKEDEEISLPNNIFVSKMIKKSTDISKKVVV